MENASIKFQAKKCRFLSKANRLRHGTIEVGIKINHDNWDGVMRDGERRRESERDFSRRFIFHLMRAHSIRGWVRVPFSPFFLLLFEFISIDAKCGQSIECQLTCVLHAIYTESVNVGSLLARTCLFFFLFYFLLLLCGRSLSAFHSNTSYYLQYNM